MCFSLFVSIDHQHVGAKTQTTPTGWLRVDLKKKKTWFKTWKGGLLNALLPPLLLHKNPWCFRTCIPHVVSRSAHGHTLLCSYLSQMIAVVKQWEFIQVAWGCCEISLFSNPWVKTDFHTSCDKSHAMTKLALLAPFSWGAELESCAHTELKCWKWTVGSWSKMKGCFVQRNDNLSRRQLKEKWHQKQSWKTWLHTTELRYQFGQGAILSAAGKTQRNMLHKSQWKAVAS